MLRENLAPGEYYHVFNRGNNKQQIFFDQRDFSRLLFLILYFQSPVNFYNLGRQASYFVKHRMFNMSDEIDKEVIKKRNVSLIGFALMPNHFHLIVREIKEGGISKYMQRTLNSYTKYFNTKYDRIGHLFQGPYKAVHVKNNEQLLYLSTYVHRNPREVKDWEDVEEKYPWSSYQDYIGENRWGNLLENKLITAQFADKKEYLEFVKTSQAKLFDEELLVDNK